MAEYNGLSRTEAIERMAVAMCLKCNNTDKCENCLSASNGDCDLKSYYPLAESALDALVGKNLSALDKLNKVN